MNQTGPTVPIRKSSLPCTPPPEWEFSSAFATGPDSEPGLLLVPGDAGPVVVRRLVTYGDWEPVRPDRWADESQTDVAAVAPAVVSPPTNRAARDRIRLALATADGVHFDDLEPHDYQRHVDMLLAVLPEQTDRAAEELATARATNQRLNFRAQRLESELAAYRGAVADWEISDRGAYVPLRALAAIAKAAGLDMPSRWELHYERVERLETELRRLAVEAHDTGTQQQEAHPPQHAWRVETRDPLADQWAPGSHFASRPHAVERYNTANSTAPLWRDGTPVERRIVRETTTYTVEEPAPVAQQPAAADGEETRTTWTPGPVAVAQAGEAARATAATYLATPCDACEHTLNWHRNDVGCTVPDCVCSRFREPVTP